MGRERGTRRSSGRRPGARPDLARLRKELQAVAGLPDQTERLLEVAAVIAAALADLRPEPVVVGGLALAYWSDSAFATGDIDVVMPHSTALAEQLEALGFERAGREWLLANHEVVFETPGELLEPGDEAERVELASGRHVLVLSLEDLLLWRLREWIHWHMASGFKQAAHLIAAEALDRERLDRRATEEGLSLGLSGLRRVEAEIETGRVFEDWELAEIGKRLEDDSYPGPR